MKCIDRLLKKVGNIRNVFNPRRFFSLRGHEFRNHKTQNVISGFTRSMKYTSILINRADFSEQNDLQTAKAFMMKKNASGIT